jgi:hypothetical protein
MWDNVFLRAVNMITSVNLFIYEMCKWIFSISFIVIYVTGSFWSLEQNWLCPLIH